MAPIPARRPFEVGTTRRLLSAQECARWARRFVTLKRARRKVRRNGVARTKLVEDPGRKVGKPEGSHIYDLVALRKAIVLCHIRCRARFDHKKADYYMDRRFPYVTGRCDGCRQIAIQAALYIHSSFLGDPGGRLRPGQCWTPL